MPSKNPSDQEMTESAMQPSGPFLGFTITLTLQVTGPYGPPAATRDLLPGGGAGSGSKGPTNYEVRMPPKQAG